MKELTLTEMESVTGAGILSLPCALTSFTIQSAFGLVKAGVEVGFSTALTVMDGAFDIVGNLFGNSPFDSKGIIDDHVNELTYSISGIWSNFVAEAATDWGKFNYALQK
ncbi:hypothetical protein [Silvania hatchlandensis]|uniref:Uncharacterized protein n=1 Tax=Silvania hatchlandensis TaxID=2926469 RepID=A0A9J6PZ82_9ENTR|nr:hypothetical protein [Silvania hatchlandensis]